MPSLRLLPAAVAVVVGLWSGRVSAVDPCLLPPVSAFVVDGFREPACRWCPGNRGLEYATTAGDRVVAAASATVVFSGRVAGTVYVVTELAGGLRITYGNLKGVVAPVGTVVVTGSLVGVAAGHVHFGIRDGDRYVDPAPMIGEMRGSPRLIPTDGSAAAPSPPPVLRCA